MIKASILTIGDEICIGQVVNTNASWIANEMTKLGYKVNLHSIIGDEESILIKELKRLLKETDIIIMTGGLGPTHDDITKPTLTKFFKDSLLLNRELLIELEDRFSKRGLKFTERNKEQALVPTKAKILKNELGTAPGLWFDYKNKIIVALPGVPSEMKYIMINSVIPLLKEKIISERQSVLLFKNLNTTGIPESYLADMIGDTKLFLGDGSLAFLPSYKGVRLRVGIEGVDFENAKEKLEVIIKYLKTKIGKYIYSEEDESIASVVGRILNDRGKTLSVAESCTAGLLGAEITTVSGSSKYFIGGVQVYSNEAKISILNVKADIIEKYGAVSEQTALELAKNVRLLFNTDYSISITGIAGPTGGSEEKPVGTVFIGISDESVNFANKYYFSKDRQINRERAVGTALTLLYKHLMGII